MTPAAGLPPSAWNAALVRSIAACEGANLDGPRSISGTVNWMPDCRFCTCTGVCQGNFGIGLPSVFGLLALSIGRAQPRMSGLARVESPLAVTPLSDGSTGPPNQVAVTPRTTMSLPETSAMKLNDPSPRRIVGELPSPAPVPPPFPAA